MSQLLNFKPEIIWPANSWCGALFEEIFDSNISADITELVDLKNNNSLDNYLVITNQDQSNFLNVPYISPNNFDSVDSFTHFASDAGTAIFYHFPLIPDWIPKQTIEAVIHAMPFRQELLKAADTYISKHLQPEYYGIHLRRTDLVLGFSDAEVKAIATQHSDKLFFICSDSEATERSLKDIPNIRINKKTDYVAMKIDSGNWQSPTLDDSGRAYYSNVRRSAQSILDAVVDLLILSRSNIIGSGGSTFFGLAKLLNTIFNSDTIVQPEKISDPHLNTAIVSNKENTQPTIIVIPIYKASLDNFERYSLDHSLSVYRIKDISILSPLNHWIVIIILSIIHQYPSYFLMNPTLNQ